MRMHDRDVLVITTHIRAIQPLRQPRIHPSHLVTDGEDRSVLYRDAQHS